MPLVGTWPGSFPPRGGVLHGSPTETAAGSVGTPPPSARDRPAVDEYVTNGWGEIANANLCCKHLEPPAAAFVRPSTLARAIDESDHWDRQLIMEGIEGTDRENSPVRIDVEPVSRCLCGPRSRRHPATIVGMCQLADRTVTTTTRLAAAVVAASAPAGRMGSS